MATRQDDSFTQLQVVDDDWRDFRKSTLSWSLDCLKFKEDPITPYFYVNRVVLHDTEDEFWRNYSSPFLIWTSPSAFNDLSTMVASKCEEFEISARFVPSNGTSEAFKKLRDGDVDLLILTGDHVRRIDPPRYVKRLGSGVVEGSEIKTLVVSNKANLSADQTFSIFKDFIDHDHHGNRINSKAFKLHTEQYSFRRQTSLASGANLFCVGNQVVDSIRSSSDAQMEGRSFVNWRHVPGYRCQEQVDAFICVSVLISGEVQSALDFTSSLDGRSDSNIRRALQQRLDKFFKPRVLNVWLNEEHLVVEDDELLTLLNKPYSKNLESDGYRDQSVKRAVIGAVTTKFLENTHGTWASFVNNAEQIVASATTLDSQTLSDLDASAQRLFEEEQRNLRQKLVRSLGGRNIGLVSGSVDEAHENRIIELLMHGLDSPRIEVEAIGVLFVSGHPLRTGS